jgi:DNA-binding LacI/PurR family transcriptional regulator
MATLKDVAERAQVSMLEAYHILKRNGGESDAQLAERVHRAAHQLGYKLNITQIDVADLAGVAKGTVSYALNGNEIIKLATREKVLEAARQLNYRSNINARNLKTNRAGIVGYSWHVHDDPSRMNTLLDEFIYRVALATESEGYHLLTFIQPQERVERVYDDLISTNRVDGFIISDVRHNDVRVQRLSEVGAPFVAFGGMYLPDNDFAYVDVDGKKGIRLVVEHLLSLGHERIGMINWHPNILIGDVRERGYLSAMEQAGIDVQPDWVAYTPNILQSASQATAQIMSAKHPPTAIVCANDVMAFGARAYLDEIGYDNVALTGYDNDPMAQFLGITSVNQPIADVATTLVEILLGEINGEPSAQRQVIFDPELVIRKSSMPAE